MPSVLRRWIVPQHSHRALCLPCCAVAAAWCQSFESEGWGPALASSLIAVFLFWLVHFRLAQRDWSVSFLHLASLKTAVSPVRCGLYFLQPHQSHTRCGCAFFEWFETKPFVQPQVALALCAGKKHKAVWLGPGNHGLKQG